MSQETIKFNILQKYVTNVTECLNIYDSVPSSGEKYRYVRIKEHHTFKYEKWKRALEKFIKYIPTMDISIISLLLKYNLINKNMFLYDFFKNINWIEYSSCLECTLIDYVVQYNDKIFEYLKKYNTETSLKSLKYINSCINNKDYNNIKNILNNVNTTMQIKILVVLFTNFKKSKNLCPNEVIFEFAKKY